MGNINSVLFVCTGNSCRSVMAEGLLKKRLKELGKTNITVRSAGIRAISGFGPTNETAEVMREEGAALDDFKSAYLTDDMIKQSDIILVMEEMHKAEILLRVPQAASKTFLLREYGRAGDKSIEDKEIPDPIGAPVSEYRICLNLIKEDIERIAKIL